jgi:anti-sigma regulatory factor (Ser/Thr protein kinase)
MIFRRRFPLRRASVAASRRFVAETCSDLSTETVDAAALMVSELVTNALIHASSDIELTIERTSDHMRVDVSDAGSGTPKLQSPRSSDLHGRGLQIVRTLSDEWGIEANADQRGKSVWFTVSIGSTTTGSGERDRTPSVRGKSIGQTGARTHRRPPASDSEAHSNDTGTTNLSLTGRPRTCADRCPRDRRDRRRSRASDLDRRRRTVRLPRRARRSPLPGRSGSCV